MTKFGVVNVCVVGDKIVEREGIPPGVDPLIVSAASNSTEFVTVMFGVTACAKRTVKRFVTTVLVGRGVTPGVLENLYSRTSPTTLVERTHPATGVSITTEAGSKKARGSLSKTTTS